MLFSTCGCAEEYVLVRVVQRVKDLSLDGVEVLELVELLQPAVLEHRRRERRQVEQGGVRRVTLRQDEVLEREWLVYLAAQPAVRDGAHVVLGGQRLEDGDGEDQLLRLGQAHSLLGQQEVLRVIDVVRLGVLHPHPKGLGGGAVHSVVPPWGEDEAHVDFTGKMIITLGYCTSS